MGETWLPERYSVRHFIASSLPFYVLVVGSDGCFTSLLANV